MAPLGVEIMKLLITSGMYTYNWRVSRENRPKVFDVVIPKEGLAGRAPDRQSFFRYDIDKDLKVCFLMMCVTWAKWCKNRSFLDLCCCHIKRKLGWHQPSKVFFWNDIDSNPVVDASYLLLVWHWQTFLSPPVLMHSGLICLAFCLSVCLWLDQNSWTKIHILGTIWDRVTKFGMVMNIGSI